MLSNLITAKLSAAKPRFTNVQINRKIFIAGKLTMGHRTNFFDKIGYNALIPRMPLKLKEAATEHETNRQRVVASILLELHFLALKNIIPKHQPLKVAKAVSQNLTGSRADSTQAAHCAPRQVIIGAHSVQKLMQKVFPERDWAVSVLFGEADILPVNFNKCDSLAEGKGLADAFQSACRYAVETGHIDNGLNPHLILMRAENAFAIYRDGAAPAFRLSEDHIKGKIKPLLIDQVVKDLTEQVQIIQQYAQTLKDLPGKRLGISRTKIEGLIKIYQ